MLVLDVGAVGEAHIKDCRRRGRSSIGPPHVLGVDCRRRRRLPEHMEIVSNVHIVALEEMTKVN